MKLATTIAIAIAICLTGCAGYGTGAAYAPNTALGAESRAIDYRNYLTNICHDRYGVEYATPMMQNCMMQVDQAQQNRNQSLINSVAAQPPQPSVNPFYIPPPKPIPVTPVPQPQQTQCHWVGQFWTCN
jgi:hypothetical protein